MDKKGLTIVIATYNERANLPRLVEQLRGPFDQAKILIVDDNSPDGTGDWVREQAKSDNRLQLLHRETKDGLGAATLAGIQQALQGPAEWVATMDADLSHRVVDLEAMWQAAAADAGNVIIGSRYVEGGRIENWSLARRLASRCVNWFARWCLWLKPKDNSGALRIYQSEMLDKIDIENISCQGYAYLEQILVHLQKRGARFYEVPITFSEREAGDSKVTIGELLRNFRDIVRVAIRRG